MPSQQSWMLQVDRNDLSRCEVIEGVELDRALGEGQVLLAVNSYAMTANNITYAVMGDTMSYWKFFPTDAGWGVVPVWGFGVVQASNRPDILVGERCYGYYPSASHVIIAAERISERSFSDGVAHRRDLPAVYNQYIRCAADPSYSEELEDIQSLLKPLFMTSFFIDDYLDDNDFFGADRVLLSSASSKTAFALAYCLHRRGVSAVGLTSEANIDFVRGLGWYSDVVPYDEIENYADGGAVNFVDMAGNSSVRSSVHRGFTDLRHSMAVGATHWTELGSSEQLAGPVPELFFAPTQIAKRAKEWGHGMTEARVADSWITFASRASEILQVEHRDGSALARAAYLAALDGSADPAVGVIVRP